ncbi:MAG: XdhC family protein [Synergistes sp.]|nr:XdhC family protein [Synergistes sp.]
MDVDLLNIVHNEVQNGSFGVLCTIVRDNGSTPRGRGSSMWVRPDGSIAGTVGGGRIEYEAIRESLRMIENGVDSALWHKTLKEEDGMASGAEAEIYMETIGRCNELLVFGGGHVGRAVAEFGTLCGFKVTVWDEREEILNPDKFSFARRVVSPIEEIYESGITIHERTYVVIMTSSHELDAKVAAKVCGKPFAYCGMIGSRKKIPILRKLLGELGVGEESFDKIYHPIGFPIKAVTPNEIAVSVMAEIISVKYGAETERMRGPNRADYK